jgi:hypothetical protein
MQGGFGVLIVENAAAQHASLRDLFLTQGLDGADQAPVDLCSGFSR